MRQYIYTCCRCGKEERTPIDSDDPPLGWARVTYERVQLIDDKKHAQTTLTTHACEGCADATLLFLEKPSRTIDDAFDHGGS
jgi:hypothetical protein